MNDRYLFKAIDTNSVWRTGLLIALKGNRCAIEESDGSKWACDAKTLCQCTGLKDKNGKLIWENDIMKYEWCRMPRVDVVKYDPPMFRYSKFVQWDLGIDEVIGNIFDNPELIKEV